MNADHSIACGVFTNDDGRCTCKEPCEERSVSVLCVPRAEYERVCEQRDILLARLEADPDRVAVAVLDGLRKVWREDDEQAMLILDWIGVGDDDLSLAERVRILALTLATKQGYTLDEAERLCPPAEVSRV